MGKKLLQPQEIEVFYVLPAIKRYLSIFMKKDGLKQNEIAKLLDLETAAVSQYLNNKRGNKVKFGDDVKGEIKISASRIKDNLTFLMETQRLLRVIRKTGTLCEIHRKLCDIPSHCEKNVQCEEPITCNV